MSLPLPPVAEPYLLPFHYGALHTIGIDYPADPGACAEILGQAHPRLAVAEFDGKACVSVNYQLYFAQYPNGGGITQEIEINIVGYPRGERRRLPRLSYLDYARGVDQTKLLGIGRIHVLCDNPIAIDAGRKLFAEPKHPATFTTAVPSLNGPATDSWSVTCHQDGDELFGFTAVLEDLAHEPVLHTPITGYGTDGEGRLLAGPMNVHHPYRHYPLADGTADRVGFTIADDDSVVGKNLRTLVGGTPAAGVWTFQSMPVAAHHRPYYLP
ncbi:hypothetical protein SD37_30500 [Amycolatopsis orientalis]|uniref:Acetoacetate decarboxylase n=1 Tax=Amycolatopsis orientalis TaxID=31958 RepID=A0A193C4Z7_AMYOR|nr:hypothetical protein [Amycolatopsis orientalis]ANN19524.1 hypothetical protein SD37_30500 [Amycolatopsis orientalis]